MTSSASTAPIVPPRDRLAKGRDGSSSSLAQVRRRRAAIVKIGLQIVGRNERPCRLQPRTTSTVITAQSYGWLVGPKLEHMEPNRHQGYAFESRARSNRNRLPQPASTEPDRPRRGPG